MGYLDVSGKSAIGGADQTSVVLGNRGINFGVMGGDTLGGSLLNGGAGVDQPPLTAGQSALPGTINSNSTLIIAGAVLILSFLYVLHKKRKR